MRIPSDIRAIRSAAPVLLERQNGHCFYCARPLRDKSHVDHFIPWSQYPHDLGHNFVLCHDSCNLEKSDTLAAAEHVAKWRERNVQWGGQIDTELRGKFVCNLETATTVAEWSYQNAEASKSRLWKTGDEYTDFDAAVLRMFQTG